MSPRSGEITRLLAEVSAGNREAEEALFTAMYEALHAIAARCVRAERRGNSLTPTVLLHEAYLRFTRTAELSVSDSIHFRALIAQVMRRILVDRARARRSAKRDGLSVPFDPPDLIRTEKEASRILGVHRALKALEKTHPDEAKVVELRWFGGFTEEECAAILDVSVRTVRRRWQSAREHLKHLVDGDGPDAA